MSQMRSSHCLSWRGLANKRSGSTGFYGVLQGSTWFVPVLSGSFRFYQVLLVRGFERTLQNLAEPCRTQQNPVELWSFLPEDHPHDAIRTQHALEDDVR